MAELKRKRKVHPNDIIKRLKVEGKYHTKHRKENEIIPLLSNEPDCQCKKECFIRIPEGVRDTLSGNFQRELKTKEEQNSHLAGLITMKAVKKKNVLGSL